MKQLNLPEYLFFPLSCLYTSWSIYLFILELPHNCIPKIISWVASFAVFPLWAEFYFFSLCYKVCCLPRNLCNFVFLDRELALRCQCRNLTLCVQHNGTLLWRKWLRNGDLPYGEQQRLFQCRVTGAVVADGLCRGTAGWLQRVLKRRGLFPTFLAEYLPAKLMGVKTAGLSVQRNRDYL